jgi:uncharacterized protein YraI
MKFTSFLAYSLLLGGVAIPLPAFAATGYLATTVNLRAGPSTSYPIVARIPGETILNVEGCLRDGSWCDVTWKRKKHVLEHGWVSSRFLESAFRKKNGQYVIRSREALEVPAVRFDIVPYWDAYYRDSDFYHERGNYMRNRNNRNRDRDRDWDNHWSHGDTSRWND